MKNVLSFVAVMALSGCMMVEGGGSIGLAPDSGSTIGLAATKNSAAFALIEEETAESADENGLTVVCGVSDASLGTEVDRMPENGRGLKLFDSAPGGTAARDFYVTGFRDGCARRFRAALALLGAPRMHEALRYSPTQDGKPYSEVDTAYERVKSRVCGASRGAPCRDGRLSALERSTGFLTIYPQFGRSGERVELLLHRGRVVARDIAAN